MELMLLDTDCERAVFRAYVRGITTRHPTIVERRAPWRADVGPGWTRPARRAASAYGDTG
ncbi:hypothetical protein N505_0120545 [Rhodococcus aetherivorans]|nr:hypothetical protein N505_0120545 [Rhodococcus aetherivorans]